MKFKIFFFIILLTSCNTNYIKKFDLNLFNSKGFAYIYNIDKNDLKLNKKKIDTNKFLIAHNYLPPGTPIKLINSYNNTSMDLKITHKIKYDDFYKILISNNLSKQLSLDKNFPLIEVQAVKRNKSFIAKKAKTFKEERTISNKAPIQKVTIQNITKITNNQKTKKIKKFSIIIGEFYSIDSARLVKERINKELPNFDIKKIIIKSNNKKNIEVKAGPYYAINLLKNDYSELKKFGFETLDIKLDE